MADGHGTSASAPDLPQSRPVLLSPASIGALNRARVIRALRDSGPRTRADLARLAGVTRATIGNIVQSLLDTGTLVEIDPDVAAGNGVGRLLWFSDTAGLSVAVALGNGVAEAGLVNARGDVARQADVAIDIENPSGEVVLDAIRALVGQTISGADAVTGIGVAVPGVCDTTRGRIITSTPIPGLAGMEIGARLEKEFGVPALIDNIASAEAMGEKWFGRGRGVGTFVGVHTGDGLGAGIVVDGTLLRTGAGMAAEIGHTYVGSTERCRCGLTGCWETTATLRWLRSEARRRRLANSGRIDSARLARLSDEGDSEAAELLDEYADRLAVGIASLVHLFAPEVIIVNGDACYGGTTLLDAVARQTRARVLPHLRETVTIVGSELMERSALLGAGGLVLSESFRLAS